jgi:hypothetical protein
MPYSLKTLPNGKTAITKKDSGKVVGKSDSKEMAQRAIAARYANEKGKGKDKEDAKDKKSESKEE